jgi:hypothetical protein
VCEPAEPTGRKLLDLAEKPGIKMNIIVPSYALALDFSVPYAIWQQIRRKEFGLILDISAVDS